MTGHNFSLFIFYFVDSKSSTERRIDLTPCLSVVRSVVSCVNLRNEVERRDTFLLSSKKAVDTNAVTLTGSLVYTS